jgi:hypothetical protein
MLIGRRAVQSVRVAVTLRPGSTCGGHLLMSARTLTAKAIRMTRFAIR